MNPETLFVLVRAFTKMYEHVQRCTSMFDLCPFMPSRAKCAVTTLEQFRNARDLRNKFLNGHQASVQERPGRRKMGFYRGDIVQKSMVEDVNTQ
jgi:hypothetical protein